MHGYRGKGTSNTCTVYEVVGFHQTQVREKMSPETSAAVVHPLTLLSCYYKILPYIIYCYYCIVLYAINSTITSNSDFKDNDYAGYCRDTVKSLNKG